MVYLSSTHKCPFKKWKEKFRIDLVFEISGILVHIKVLNGRNLNQGDAIDRPFVESGLRPVLKIDSSYINAGDVWSYDIRLLFYFTFKVIELNLIWRL